MPKWLINGVGRLFFFFRKINININMNPRKTWGGESFKENRAIGRRYTRADFGKFGNVSGNRVVNSNSMLFVNFTCPSG